MNKNEENIWLKKLYKWIDQNNIVSVIHASHYDEWTGQYREGNVNEGILENKSDITTVTSLNLISKGLNELPKEIGKLINLKALYITANDIRYLPDEIMQLRNLEEFYFVGNDNLILTAEQKEWISTLDTGNSMIEYEAGENEQYLIKRLEIIKLAIELYDVKLIKSQIAKAKSFKTPTLTELLFTIEKHLEPHITNQDKLIRLINLHIHKIGEDDYFFEQQEKIEANRQEIFLSETKSISELHESLKNTFTQTDPFDYEIILDKVLHSNDYHEIEEGTRRLKDELQKDEDNKDLAEAVYQAFTYQLSKQPY